MEANKDPKIFWKTVKVSLTPPAPNISESQQYDHFNSLLFSENQNLGPQNEDDAEVDNTADILNEEITIEEIISTINSLKTGKSAGPDMISAEFYKSTATDIAPILKYIFYSILDSGVCPKSFGETILCPLHKSRPTSDPNNLRGISLVNTMNKIFSSILNKRLYAWVEENEKLDDLQARFRAGYSAIDNIFSLSSVIQILIHVDAADSSIICLLTSKKSIRYRGHEQPFKSLMKKEYMANFKDSEVFIF